MSDRLRRVAERARAMTKHSGDMAHILALAERNGGRITYGEISEIIFRRRTTSELIRTGVNRSKVDVKLMERVQSGDQLTETDRDKLILVGLARKRAGGIRNLITYHGAVVDKQARVVNVPSKLEKINNKDSKNAT